MQVVRIGLFATAFAVVLAPLAARAADVRVSADLTLNLVDGKHDTGSGVDRLDFVPLPLAEVDASLAGTTLHLEGLPPVSFTYGTGSPQRTELSLLNASLRRSLGGGTFAGIGQTVINQRTTYRAPLADGVVRQSSRVTGLRFEAGVTRSAFRATMLEYVFAFDPAMHGVERTLLRGQSAELPSAERAVQLDTSLRFVRALKHGALIYGIRYVNYASRYDLRGTGADGLLADRNTGFMPLAGYRIRF